MSGSKNALTESARSSEFPVAEAPATKTTEEAKTAAAAARNIFLTTLASDQQFNLS